MVILLFITIDRGDYKNRSFDLVAEPEAGDEAETVPGAKGHIAMMSRRLYEDILGIYCDHGKEIKPLFRV